MSKPKAVKPPPEFPGVIVVDTREQLRYTFHDIKADAEQGGGTLVVNTKVDTLSEGDYSLEGYEKRISIERKSLSDLYGTIGGDRKRFERELSRLACYDYSAVVVEADWRAIAGDYPVEVVAMRDYCIEQLSRNAPGLKEQHPWNKWLGALEALLIYPPAYSELNPKTIYRSVLAWQQRYPGTHWWFCHDRRFAEITTFRLLYRYWQDRTSGKEVGSVGSYATWKGKVEGEKWLASNPELQDI